MPQVFALQVHPVDELFTSDVVVNDQHLDISWHDRSAGSSQVISIPGTSGILHEVHLRWNAFISNPRRSIEQQDDETQLIHFEATPLDGVGDLIPQSISFALTMRPTSELRLVELFPDQHSGSIYFEDMDDVSMSDHSTIGVDPYETSESHESDGFDLEFELESVALLQAQAQKLQGQIAAKKKAIADNVRQERSKLCLKHLIKECDGVVSAAKAIAQRICDKIGIPTGSSFQYAHVKDHHVQQMGTLDAKSDWANSKGGAYHAESAHMPIMLTKNVTQYAFKPIDLVNPPNPFVRALQVIGAALGISALFVFLKRRCMSMRKRVERAADIEERRNERAYKRAARRALMRKRWDNFVGTISCFRSKEEPRIEDYEEKRALILQDAFLEQDLDQAEKGEVMEAEIRELRYAHEIVSSLVRMGEHRYDLVTPVNDPPPPLVPLPYTPVSRSRASTFTLPSYTSESLPDYSSRPGNASSSSSVLGEYTPPTTDAEGRHSPVSVVSDSSARTRYTPTSSILETSPRPSQETLRTRQSRDTHDR